MYGETNLGHDLAFARLTSSLQAERLHAALQAGR